jgi:5'-deoxynucleotidase YfbR-like HD superfamily hydrolase
MRDLQFMWDGGETRRYHGFRMLMEDTVGHHSYNVACIIMTVRPAASAKLLRAALKHDAAEHRVGDLPAPTKRALPHSRLDDGWRTLDPGVEYSFREVFGNYEESVAEDYGVDLEQDLPPEDAWVLKFADSLDGMRFCANERALGNKTRRLEECYEAFDSYVRKLLFNDDHFEFAGVAQIKPLAQHATELDREAFLYVESQWSRIR